MLDFGLRFGFSQKLFCLISLRDKKMVMFMFELEIHVSACFVIADFVISSFSCLI